MITYFRSRSRQTSGILLDRSLATPATGMTGPKSGDSGYVMMLGAIGCPLEKTSDDEWSRNVRMG